MSKPKCVWGLGDDCSENISTYEMFDPQIKIPACDNHFEQHKEIMFLHSKGHDVEELIMLSREERRELFKKVRAEFPDEEIQV